MKPINEVKTKTKTKTPTYVEVLSRVVECVAATTKMAAASCVSTLPRGNKCSFDSEVLDTNCPNCFVLNEQLEIVTQELKSATTIVSLLKDLRFSSVDMLIWLNVGNIACFYEPVVCNLYNCFF
jgi:hypothetical protein